jgi:hypothetical protein
MDFQSIGIALLERAISDANPDIDYSGFRLLEHYGIFTVA